MATILKAAPREDLRGSATRKVRKEGYVPGILYGNKIESQPVSVEGVEFLKTVREVGINGLFSLEINGKDKHQVMIHDVQRDPLKNEFLHIDFFEVDMTSKIDVDVAIRLTGEAPGEKDEGGIVSHLLYHLTVRCLPSEIPEEITVEISKLNIGDSIQVGDIRSTVDVEITNEDEETVVTILAPAAKEEPEQLEEEETGAETESGAEDEQKDDE